MTDLQVTRHADMRMAQRGLTQADIELIMELGSEVEGGFLLRKKDAEGYLRGLREQIRRIERLEGKRLVLADDHLVTAYHASPRDTKRLLRN